MTSKVEICNIALSNVRAGSINSIDELSVKAQQCKLKYDSLLEMILRDAPHQFAHKNQALAVLSRVDIFNWVYAYQYPSNCLYINYLQLNFESVSSDETSIASRSYARPDLNNPVNYEIFNVDGNRVIAANETELRIDFRSRVTDPNLFDVGFILAFAHLLGSELAVPLVGGAQGKKMQADELALYQAYIDTAIAATLNEQQSTPPESEFVTIRQG